MPAAIGSVQDYSVVAHRPAFRGIEEFHVQQVSSDAGRLRLPGAAAVDGAKDAAATANCPPQTPIYERHGIESDLSRRRWRGRGTIGIRVVGRIGKRTNQAAVMPGLAAVHCLQGSSSPSRPASRCFRR